MGAQEKTVKDIMCRIEEYEKIDSETSLREALNNLKKYAEQVAAGEKMPGHKTTFVTDASGKIIGKLSFYDFIKALVPEPAKDANLSKKLASIVSSRALEVTAEITEMRKHFEWMHNTFGELVKKEAGKKVKDVMSPIHPVLKEDDGLNKAIFEMFKENIRQPLVTRDGEIVGVVNLMGIFPELLQHADD